MRQKARHLRKMRVNSGRPSPIFSSAPLGKRTAKSMPDRFPIRRKVLSTTDLTAADDSTRGLDRTRYTSLLMSPEASESKEERTWPKASNPQRQVDKQLQQVKTERRRQISHCSRGARWQSSRRKRSTGLSRSPRTSRRRSGALRRAAKCRTGSKPRPKCGDGSKAAP